MHHVRPAEPEKGWQIARFDERGPHVPVAPNPAEPPGEDRVNWNELHFVALAPQSAHELTDLDGVPAQDVGAGRDERDPRMPHAQLRPVFSTSQFPMASYSSQERSKTSS